MYLLVENLYFEVIILRLFEFKKFISFVGFFWLFLYFVKKKDYCILFVVMLIVFCVLLKKFSY